MLGELKRLVRERTILAGFQQFTAAAARRPKEVAALYPVLAEAAAEALSEDEFARAETTLLVAPPRPRATVGRRMSGRWRERSVARSAAGLATPRALRRATSSSLVERLSELLLVRAGARAKSHDKKEVILAMRRCSAARRA